VRDELDVAEDELYSERFLVRRPLLRSLQASPGDPRTDPAHRRDRPCADNEFEAYLLEILSDYAVTIPELGTIRRHGPSDRRPHLEPDARMSKN